ncbi:hypothetical protein AB0J82_36420 [Asanoa sp. NPDC049518]|uniref:hypothetical protein n=1 Tax=unclassified Asanoa TaxID=2685164 RepID=UPI00341B6203
MSVLLRGAIWVLSMLTFGPLFGPFDLYLWQTAGRSAAEAITICDITVSVLLAVATAVASVGVRSERRWALRLGGWLALFYVGLNIVTAIACVVLWHPLSLEPVWVLAVPLALYILSAVAATVAWSELQGAWRLFMPSRAGA